ncbi:ATP-dependent RNA helicase DEAH11, chloroplastic [Hypsizygus marmoreus]|uniref:RBR-type E3 ubiquitin transferase n=1 Tax=Hypsizygus marmoreus TaxID=39966 RepID=A0A369JEC3_HYPMA|nr:ATP-dependent RNA helicase DEAH11, chloroplastic [Hypsizygus marmoreus]
MNNSGTSTNRLCSFFLQGKCRFDQNCKFAHLDPPSRDIFQRIDAHGARVPDDPQTTANIDTMPAERQVRGRGRKDYVSEANGVRQSPETAWTQAERSELQRVQAQLAEEITRQHGLQARREAERKARQAEQEALKAKNDAAVVTQHVVFGSTLISCGAGIEIRSIISGFESCRLTIKNLPPDAKREEISALFTQQGIPLQDFLVLQIKPVDEGRHLEVNVLTRASLADLISVGLDGIDFRNERLAFKVSSDASPDAMGESSARDPHVLTISWRAPSTAMIVTYASMDEARARALSLDKNVWCGRKIHVEMNKPPVGPALRYYNPCSVKITGLPVGISPALVAVYSGTSIVKEIKSNIYNLDDSMVMLKEHLRSLPYNGVRSYELVSENESDGLVTMRVHFESWTHARRALDSLEGKRLRPEFPPYRLFLPHPIHFSRSISAQQFLSQQRLWDSLPGPTTGKGAHVRIYSNTEKTLIRVMGDDEKAVGALKVRVETLLSGEKLDASFWHRSFMSPTGREVLERIYSQFRVYVRVDSKELALRIYGDGTNMDVVRRIILAGVNQFSGQEWKVFLKRQSVSFFVRTGLAMLKETLGEDSVTLDVISRPCAISVRGGEDARHQLSKLIDLSLDELAVDQHIKADTSNTCPICYDQVSIPIKLGCKHTYCSACIRHYVTSADDSTSFPLVCLGDEAKCRTPISIPTIQHFLTRQQYDRLVQVAFSVYVDHHSQDLKYCTTPDCNQIYRSNSGTTLKCPSCFAEVCSSCHDDAHEGMLCQEQKLRKAFTEQLDEAWATKNGIKRCPACQVWIEKKDGCNHITCAKCNAHSCWICMKTFDTGELTYNHLTTEHGGFWDGEQNRDYERALALQRELDAL